MAAVRLLQAGHPGMLVKAWTPASPAIRNYYIVASSVGHTAQQEGCNTGCKVNADGSATTPNIPPSHAWGSSASVSASVHVGCRRPAAVAVFLLNNHQSNTYADVEITLSEVGFAPGAPAAIWDVWRLSDNGTSSAAGTFKVTVGPRDSQLLLLRPLSTPGVTTPC